MAKKTLFNPPDSQEREYTRLLLAYSRRLIADVNRVLVPQLGNLTRQANAELRADTWSEDLALIMLTLAQLALEAITPVIRRLPGQFEAVSRQNEGQFKLVVRANTGLDLPTRVPAAQLLGINVFRTEPFLAPLAENWVKTNTDLIKSLPTRLHPELEGIIRRGVMNGASVKQLSKEIKARYGVTEYRARLIAQDQTLSLNADLTRYRLQSVGVKRFIWRSVQDSRVRPEHAEYNGKEYAWDKPPPDGLPGQPVRCRCRAEGIFPTD